VGMNNRIFNNMIICPDHFACFTFIHYCLNLLSHRFREIATRNLRQRLTGGVSDSQSKEMRGRGTVENQMARVQSLYVPMTFALRVDFKIRP